MSKEGKRTSKDIFVQRDVERSTESNERYRPPHRTSDTRHTNGSSREIEKRKEHTTDKYVLLCSLLICFILLNITYY